jgi:hypothetical protein
MAEEKSQGLKMGAGLAVVMHRIVAKIFGGAGIDEQRTRMHRGLDEVEHDAPVVLSGYLREHFAALSDA